MWGRIVAVVIAVMIAAAAAWALWPKPITVEIATIGKRDLDISVEEEGRSHIREIFTVSAPVAGRLMRLAIHPGDRVVADQTVVASIQPAAPPLLDDRSRRIAEAAAQAAEAAVTLATAQLEQAEAQLEFAGAELDRTKTLAEKGLVSAQTLQRATLSADTAAKGVDAAEAALAMRIQDLQSARSALMEGETSQTPSPCCVDVRAPASGTVLAIRTESEQVIQSGTPLMDIGDLTDLDIEVEVLSTDAVRIVPGSPAGIEGWGGEPLRAEVERIEPTAITKVSALGIEEQRTLVRLRLLDGPEHRKGLGNGFRVLARIVLWQGRDLVAVPMSALFRSGEDWAVFTLEDGRARTRKVTLGERNADYAQLIDGLEMGDVVVVHPGDTVADGVAVAIAATTP